jgi:hypothetical protein
MYNHTLLGAVNDSHALTLTVRLVIYLQPEKKLILGKYVTLVRLFNYLIVS